MKKPTPMKLSNSVVKDLPTPERHDLIQGDTSITGLKVRVTRTGTKTFYLYYKHKSTGKQRKYRIGKFGDIGVPEAREAAKRLHARIELGEDPQGELLTNRQQQKAEKASKLRTFLEEKYYPYAERHQKAHWRTKQILTANFDFLMEKRMDQITPWLMDKWQREQLHRGIKPSTINRATTAIKAVLNKAVEWDVIKASPLGRRKRLKVDGRGVVRWLSDEEEKRLYKVLATRKGHLPVIVTVLLNTGARPKEAFTLKWEDVDFQRREITLHAAFTKTGQTRRVPLNDAATAVLKKWKEESGSDWVFPGDDGEHITTINKGWKKVLKDAGITNFRLYDCRHTFASKLVMRGVDLYTVAELLGHSSIEMTKVYAHLSQDHLSQAVSVL